MHDAKTGSPISYKTGAGDPLKAPAILLALANELGLVPWFNCKSGKDRCGLLDTEVKALYIAINENAQMPPPLRDRQEALAPKREAVFHQSGQDLIQKLNTGVRGTKISTKVEGLDQPPNRSLPNDIRGLSSYASSARGGE
jgi:hypothetical protein